MSALPSSGEETSSGAPEKLAEAQKESSTTAAAADKGTVRSLTETNAKMDAAGGDKSSEHATTKSGAESAATRTAAIAKPRKIKVHLVAVGSAPILKKSKFLMNADDRFAVAIAFLRKVLKLSSSTNTGASPASSLFVYVNSAFVPSPDERLGDLFDCFGVRGELVLHYSLQEAWG